MFLLSLRSALCPGSLSCTASIGFLGLVSGCVGSVGATGWVSRRWESEAMVFDCCASMHPCSSCVATPSIAPSPRVPFVGFLNHAHTYGAPQVALVAKNPPANAETQETIPGLGRSPGGGHGNPLQYSCLENPMDRGTWQAIVHSVVKSWTQLK